LKPTFQLLKNVCKNPLVPLLSFIASFSTIPVVGALPGPTRVRLVIVGLAIGVKA
jgi:hypothetical protein